MNPLQASNTGATTKPATTRKSPSPRYCQQIKTIPRALYELRFIIKYENMIQNTEKQANPKS